MVIRRLLDRKTFPKLFQFDFYSCLLSFVRGGYDVYVDGIVGPWFLEPWLRAAREGYEVHYIVLRASRETTLRRAVERSKLDLKTNTELVEVMWEHNPSHIFLIFFPIISAGTINQQTTGFQSRPYIR